MDGVDPNMIVGASTEVIAGEGLFVTAGGVDSHVHQVSPEIVTIALESGVTTLLGGGTGLCNRVKGDKYFARKMEYS